MWPTRTPSRPRRIGIERELGPIDIWVNDGMATVFSPVSGSDAKEFRRGTEVTYLGTVHGTMAALKRMQPRRRGTIVNVGSVDRPEHWPLWLANL